MIKKPDLAQAYTDAETLRIEKEMRKVYKDCEKDIKAKMTDFAQKHKVKDAKYRQMVEDGKMAKEDYDAWKQGQVFTGEQWKAKREQIANSLYDANDAAHKIAQGHVSNVFAFNANYTNYKLEKNVNANLGFGLYNNASVARLLRENPQLLPAKKLNKAKDIQWNMKNIKRELTKSIIQGESIDDLTERLSKEMPNRSFKQARVHARTMMTSAQNAGRLEAMYEHKAMGIETLKVWLATLDERTRWMHRDLDGQERELDEYFEIGQYAIRFPADPLAAPAMVYNCRCTMEEKLKKYPDVDKMRRDNTVKPRDMSDENDGVIKYMTYNQWAEWKGVANERPNGMKPVMPVENVEEEAKTTATEYAAKLLASASVAEAVEIAKLIDDADDDMQYLYREYTEQCRSIVKSRDGGAYNAGLDKVDWSVNDIYEEQHKYSTMAHEMGHMFDAKIGVNSAFSYSEANAINDRMTFGSGAYKFLKETASTSDDFLKAVRADKLVLREKLKDASFVDDLKKSDASAGIQDALDGMFGTRGKNRVRGLNWGHGDKYYNRFYNDRVKGFGKEKDLKALYTELGFDASNQEKVKWISRDYETASEVWANVSSAVLCGGGELEYFEKCMPNTMQTYREMIRKVAHG